MLDLVTNLIEGAFETPLWSSFLDGFRRATAADYAILIFDPPGRPMDEGRQLVSGDERAALVAELVRSCIQDARRRQPIDEGRLVALADLFQADQARNQAAYCALVDDIGVTDARMARVSEPRGVNGWLTIVRRGGAFSSQDDAMLAAMIRPLRGVLRSHVSAESDKLRSSMAAEAVRRLQCGWFLLDRDGFVLVADAFGQIVLANSGVLSSSAAGRLSVRPAKLESKVLQAVAELADKPEARPRAISLRSDPWLDMLLVPPRKKMLSDTAAPSVIAYVHGDSWRSADRCSQLCDMFELAHNEARLALALCRGKSIAEAAAELGLSLETTRSYSKVVYAKTGARGMADLVRIVMGSVLTLAPDA